MNHRSTPPYRQVILLYMALLLGQIFFCLVVVFLNTQPDDDPYRTLAYPYLPPLILLLTTGAAWYLNNLRQQQGQQLVANYTQKLAHYRTTVIMRSAALEAGNLFCLTLALLEQSLFPLLYFCLGLVVFLYFRPGLNDVLRSYSFSAQEIDQLQRDLRGKL